MENNHINYIEFKAHDLDKIKSFYSQVFGWAFTDYGPSYTSFAESGVFGGFEKTDAPIVNGAVVVLYHKDLKLCKNKVLNAGGTIPIDIFTLPGGKRFHFTDPDGNELAVWSE